MRILALIFLFFSWFLAARAKIAYEQDFKGVDRNIINTFDGGFIKGNEY